MDVEETIHIVEIEGAGEAFYDSPSLQPDSITVDDFDSNSGGGGGNDDLDVDDDGQGDGDEGPGDGGGGGGVLRTAEPLDEELQPRSKKLKKNQSAFMIFCNTHREDVKQEQPGLSMTELTKVLAAKWRELEEVEKSRYAAIALDDKERYLREFKEQLAQGISEAELRGTFHSNKDIPAYETVIPIGRVRRTCKLDPDVKNISKEATVLVAKATEYFLAKIAEESFKMSSLSGRCTLKPDDIRECVGSLPQYEW